MKKKLLAVLLSALMIVGVTPLFASASYVDQGESYGYWICADGQYRNLWNKYSVTSKASHLGTNMKGYGEIAAIAILRLLTKKSMLRLKIL